MNGKGLVHVETGRLLLPGKPHWAVSLGPAGLDAQMSLGTTSGKLYFPVTWQKLGLTRRSYVTSTFL